MDKDIKNYMLYLKNERNYSKLTLENYLFDLNKYKDYLDEHKINYINITKDGIINAELSSNGINGYICDSKLSINKCDTLGE